MTHARVVFAGLPFAGKTTYLAALWNALDAREITTDMKLISGPNNKKYLNEVLSSWHEGVEVARTGAGTEEYIEMVLETKGGRHLTIELPDVSGEAFRDMWAKRTWGPKLKEYAAASTGVVLFVHPDHIVMPVRIDEQNLVIPLSEPTDVAITTQAGPVPPFDPNKTPTATQLVFLLQALQGASSAQRAPIVVVISAWDRLAGTGYTPHEWLSKTLPLLTQYLKSNESCHEYAIIGVSALGGDIKDAATREKLLDQTKAAQRVRVVHDIETNDITRPLQWLAEAME